MEILRIENIEKSYGNRTILNKVTLCIHTNEVMIVSGENGAGKSTLLNIISMLMKPDNGMIYFKGKCLDWSKDKVRDTYRRDHIGIITQDFSLLYDKSVFDNIALSLHAQKYKEKIIKDSVQRVVTELGITHLADKFPDELSGGECQKVAIARALVKKPDIILADEPTASLDQQNRDGIMKIMRELAQQGIAVVMVTHDINISQYADKFYTLRDNLLVRKK